MSKDVMCSSAKSMHVIHVASELAPVAKVGGLADVVYGLSQELQKQGDLVEIILPKYDCMNMDLIKDLRPIHRDLKCYYDGSFVLNTVWQGSVDGLTVFFIEPHNTFFTRKTFYDCMDNADRFAYFSRAVLEFLLATKKNPDVLHCHDWHAALIAVLLHEVFKELGLKVKGTLLTIHNLQHQGLCLPATLNKVGLSSSYLHHFSKLQDPHRFDRLNILKGGIVYCTYFTTVSPNYAKEIQTPLGGCGLDPVIRYYHYKFGGILNGLDYTYWNPATDPYLDTHYRANCGLQEGKKDLALFTGKKRNKEALKKRLQLVKKNQPLVGCITRLVEQKGIHLIEHALFRTLQLGGQFVLLGTSSDPDIHTHFLTIKHNLARNRYVHFELQYNEELTHQIYAGCDFLIVPSLFEPCGLTQLLGLRYGCVPIVRNTGGLVDTIFDVDYSDKPLIKRNGYSFNQPDFEGVNSALDRALLQWQQTPEIWERAVYRGMLMDYSWENSTKQYRIFYKMCTRL